MKIRKTLVTLFAAFSIAAACPLLEANLERYGKVSRELGEAEGRGYLPSFTCEGNVEKYAEQAELYLHPMGISDKLTLVGEDLAVKQYAKRRNESDAMFCGGII